MTREGFAGMQDLAAQMKRTQDRIELPRAVNWTEIGLVFRRNGKTHAWVAKELNLSQQTVSEWFSRNREPGFSNGVRCYELYLRITLEPATDKS